MHDGNLKTITLTGRETRPLHWNYFFSRFVGADIIRPLLKKLFEQTMQPFPLLRCVTVKERLKGRILWQI